MQTAENVNAPWLGGFILGAAAGLVAFAALVVVGKFDLVPAVACGGVIAALAGAVLGLPWGGSAPRVAVKKPAAKPVAMPAAMASAAPAAEPMAAPVAAPVAAFVSSPAAAPVAVSAEGPARLNAPRGGKADDLKEIEGIGPAMEKLVNEMGFFHFDQLAGWSAADVAWVDANLKGFKGRVTRDKWVAQAKIIVGEGLAAFRIRAKTNDY